MVCNHPDPELLLEYSTGSLQLAPSVAVKTHLHYCDACAAASNSLEDIGGHLLDCAQYEEVSESLLDEVLCALDEPESEPKHQGVVCEDAITDQLPPYVRGLLPESLDWRKLSPSLRVAPISVGEKHFELALHKIAAGGKVPVHDHKGQEITVVLKGSFSDEDGVYQPGDFLVREPGESHRPIAAQNDDCICLSVLEAPIKLKGLKRVLNPFLNFSPS